MAIAATRLICDRSNVDTTPPSVFTTASISPTASALVLLAVEAINSASSTPAAPTVTGASMTWVQEETVAYDTGGSNRGRLTVFRAMSASPGSGALSILFGEMMTNCEWSVIEFTGVDTSGSDGAGAIVQSVPNNASATSLTVTLAAFGSGDNATYATFCHQANEAETINGGYTQHNTFGASRVASLSAGFLLGNDTTPDASWTTSALCGGIGIEVKAAAGGGGDPSAGPAHIICRGGVIRAL